MTGSAPRKAEKPVESMKFAIIQAAPAPAKVETESHAQCLLHVWRTGWPVLSARTTAMSALLAANCASPSTQAVMSRSLKLCRQKFCARPERGASAPTAAAVEQAITDALKRIVSGFFCLLTRGPPETPPAAASRTPAGPP